MKILLTRPKNDSIKTSKTLRKFSLAFEISPLLKIKKHKCDVDYSKFDIIIFSSKNGVRFSDIDKRKIKENVLIFTVGTETTKLLNKKANYKILNVEGNIFKLKNQIRVFLKKGMKILHPTFRNKNTELENFFLKFKCNYTAFKCYNSEMVNVCETNFINFIMQNDQAIIPIYSSLTANAFIKEIKRNNLESFCTNKKFVVISQKVKKELVKGKLDNIFVAEKPDEKHMIKLIKEKYLEDE